MNTIMTSIPEDGDIVIREEKREGMPVYVLNTVPGAGQILLRTCEPAIARALAFAKRQHVRAWLTADGYNFALLEDFRSNEWSVFRGAHPHALLIGSEESAQAVITLLLRYLRAPLVHWRPRTESEVPETGGTLVVWGVDALGRMQQLQLLEWMDGHAADGQVISVAPSPVFPLALRDEFLNTLYYRLNTVCLPLSNRVDVPTRR